MDLTLLLLALLLKQEVAGLKLIRINVPPYTLRGKSALLECRYDLETDKLYTITWYKDDEEFYRYVPRGEPTKHSYPVEGVKVDHRRSDHQQVLLQDVSLHSSGQYKCEVSGEAPNFNSVSAEASMEVVVLPQDGPTITGEEKIYATGDVLGLNCTSDKSHPAAKLKWFINGAEIYRMEYSEHEFKCSIESTSEWQNCSKMKIFFRNLLGTFFSDIISLVTVVYT
ncbi:basal cell adhesion molecule-like isoform X3 [Hylaeus anthracinus]|uniref:basal cell adhesion molecule-like isoform X3 n=1 Tax=Hylaeus anthracinus TaxID=313031 RepID=UPI0023B92EB4|nr:basal cell adhesion molecule-like isoform X3 [Hylaeus anthracinus]